ncbi:MAG: helix-turn-helix domain-containing protein [Bacteroidota bacterium]
MEITNQLLFFFSGLGVFNGLLMSLYFLFSLKPKRLPNQLFGLLILMLTMRIGKSVFLYFLEDLSKIILQIGLSACVFIGPLLFFYIKSTLQPKIALKKSLRIHIAILLVLTLTVGIIFPYPLRPDLWNPLIVQGIYAIWLIYMIASALQLKTVIIDFFNRSSALSTTQKWLLVVFSTNLAICLVFHSILYFGFPSYILGPITFSFVFYALLAFLLFHSKRDLILHGEKPRYHNKKIKNEQVLELKSQLDKLMNEQALYKQSNLKLDNLAQALNVTPHTLSQYLNDNVGKTFSLFVNEYRIEAACELLQTDHQFTLEGVGHEVGFRSKSNFYASFKKIKGCTPNQFVKNLPTSSN